ncbi:hypothetical protein CHINAEXTREME_04545 [Halobiforma lacisalsi AJ5]|uniref:Mn2+/Fe2+ transporter n=1 Tax=Natronobacterium lacisalsi AJ5 TaxID=358396 RepID=M0LPL7_NATLA|nr:hypothetical protein [Halobiforma lacisalsi]APW97082.1 hypothetical protein CHINAEXTREME_04545 [Halobiforma lacisalsi AJ5]EMA34414.1 hypothetical protein C445_07807 [Halobiforma lacisalsi AJ5]
MNRTCDFRNTDPNGPSSERLVETTSGSGGVGASVLFVCTLVGIGGTVLTQDSGTAVTWFWIGIGATTAYFLYRIVATLERIAERL